MRTNRSPWTVLAAVVLLALALLFAGTGILLLSEIPVRGHVPGASGGVFEAILGAGVGLVLVAIVHVVAAAMAWRGASLALARAVAWAGVILGAVAVGLSLIGARDVTVLMLAFPLVYGAVLICLSSSRGQDATRDGAADAQLDL